MLCLRKVGGQQRASEADHELEGDIGDFIDDDLAGEDWRMELQQITGYDPNKCVLVPKPTLHAAAVFRSTHDFWIVHLPPIEVHVGRTNSV